MRAFFLILAIIFLSTNLYSQNLDTVWTKIYDFSEDDYKYINLYRGIATSDSCFVLLGDCTFIDEHNSDESFIYTIKLNKNGDTLWSRKLGNNYVFGSSSGYGLVESVDSNILILGSERQTPEHTIRLYKLDTSGTLLWEKDYSISIKGGYLSKMTESSEGNIFAIGGSRIGLFVIKFDAYGDSLWTRYFGWEHFEEIWDIIPTNDGGAIISGKYSIDDFATGEIFVRKIDSLGNEDWILFHKYYGRVTTYEYIPLIRLNDGTFAVVAQEHSEEVVRVYKFNADGIKLDSAVVDVELVFWLYDTFTDNQNCFYLIGGSNSGTISVVKISSSFELEYSHNMSLSSSGYGFYINKDSYEDIYIFGSVTQLPEILIIKLVEDFPVSVLEAESLVPFKALLSQNYPNPFNPSTRIDYAVESKAHVIICVYNSLGQLVQTLVDNEKPAGQHSTTWNGLDSNGKQAATGVYFYRVSIGDYIESKKMMLLK